MANSYTYSLKYTRDDGSLGGMSGGRETLADTIKGLAHDIAYYQGIGYSVVAEFLRENCPDCKGNGDRAHKANKLRRIKCHSCKGSGARQIIDAR